MHLDEKGFHGAVEDDGLAQPVRAVARRVALPEVEGAGPRADRFRADPAVVVHGRGAVAGDVGHAVSRLRVFAAAPAGAGLNGSWSPRCTWRLLLDGEAAERLIRTSGSVTPGTARTG